MTLPESFTQLLDRSLTSDGRVSTWCPTMDLLAIATADGQVAVYRLIWQPPSWQQLWAVAPESSVTSLCWRPDGKALAVGHADGSVAIMGVEGGELLHRTGLHESSIVAISWVEGHDTVPVEDRANRFFPTAAAPEQTALLTTNDVYANLDRAQAQAAFGRTQLPMQQHKMNMVVTIDTVGTVNVCMMGTFLLASFKLHDILPTSADVKDLQPADVAQSRDLRQLAILCMATSSTQQQMRLAVVDTGVFADRSVELQNLALQMSEINGLLDRASEAMREAGGKWQDAMKQVGAKWEQMGSVLADHGLEVSAQQDLLNLLSSGIPSDGTRHFLQATLGEQNTKRIAKSVDAAAVKVHAQLLGVVSPALEMAVFRLGELQGLAACSDWIQPIELQADILKDAEQQCSRLLIRVKQVMMMVSRAGTLYRSFFLWLLKTILILNFENADPKPLQDIVWPTNNTKDVLEFLESEMLSDAIVLELMPSYNVNGKALDDVSGSAWPRMAWTQKTKELHSLFLGRPAQSQDNDPRLSASLQTLKSTFEQVMVSLPPMMASSLRSTAWIALNDGHKPGEPGVRDLRGDVVGRLQAGEDPSKIDLIVAIPTTQQNGGPAEAKCLLANIQHNSRAFINYPRDFSWGNLGLPVSAEEQDGSRRPSELPSACPPDITAIVFVPPDTSPTLQAKLDTRVLDIGFYKNGQVALLTGLSGQNEQDAGDDPDAVRVAYTQTCQLFIANTKDAPSSSWIHVSNTNIGSQTLASQSLLSMHSKQGAICSTIPDKSIRFRACHGMAVGASPLAVSATRGVGCILASNQRAILFDLEEDEEDDEAAEEAGDNVSEPSD